MIGTVELPVKVVGVPNMRPVRLLVNHTVSWDVDAPEPTYTPESGSGHIFVPCDDTPGELVYWVTTVGGFAYYAPAKFYPVTGYRRRTIAPSVMSGFPPQMRADLAQHEHQRMHSQLVGWALAHDFAGHGVLWSTMKLTEDQDDDDIGVIRMTLSLTVIADKTNPDLLSTIDKMLG